MLDACGRTIDYVRISITDRCNLRCVYCMPEHGVAAFTHGDVLTYEEILRVVGLLSQLGVRHVRVTGGEPMARRGCLELIERIHAIDGIETISMTTNALLLEGQMERACAAGLNALNISLDTLDPETYRRMTRGGDVRAVRSVIGDALRLGVKVKINAVPVRGWNDRQLCDLAALARDMALCVRFIELMPVGCGAQLEPVPSDEVRRLLEDAFGPMEPDTARHGFGPASYYQPQGFAGAIGLISPLSHAFCADCNRVRLTADGFLKLCLNHTAGTDLRALLRSGADDALLLETLRSAIYQKPARHGFGETIGDREVRRMNEIGG